MQKKTLTMIGAAALLALAGCSSGSSLDGAGDAAGDATTLSIGSANFSENVLLAHIYGEALSDAGFDVQVKPNIGSREVLIPALQDQSIDIVPEYSGALLAFLDNDTEAFASDDVLSELEAALPEDLAMLEASDAEDKDALVVTRETAEEHDLASIADLQPVAGDMVLGGPPETKDRRAGIPGLESLYGITFREFKSVDLGGPLTVAGLNNGDLDVALMFTTQPAIAENDFVVLEDPESMSLAENIVPVLRADRVDPEIERALNEVSAALTTEILIDLNRAVEVDKEDPQKVARAWVDEH